MNSTNNTPFYQLSIDEVFRKLDSSISGISTQTLPSLQEKFGKNVLREARRRTRLSILLSQFSDVMILILVIAAGISLFVGEHTDAVVILAIIIANAWLGYSQEYDAEQSIRMLQKMSSQYALVLRNGGPLKIASEELVPGDMILLEAGDIVPADARIIEGNALKTDESSLTGESHSAEKIADTIPKENLVPGDQENMVFKGTHVINGTGKAVVTSTGMETEIGKIAGLMEIVEQKTPLQIRLAKFSKQLALIVIVICCMVFLVGWWRGEPLFLMFLTALSLAVAALPEALPAVVTIALARGAQRMVKQNALVRKLPAVETLGSVTYICSDKTGTLTKNEMTVEKTFSQNEELFTYAMMLNNDVKFSHDKQLLGDSTETALVKFALQRGLSREEAVQKFPLLQKLPFDSQRMRMSTLHSFNDGYILFVKGAPIKIVEVLSPRYAGEKEEWLNENRKWASEGLRVLFFAFKIFPSLPGVPTLEIEKDLDFLGMAAMIDPPRNEVIEAISQCKTAGIRTVMITGDQALTALSIAKRLEMLGDSDKVWTGAEMFQLPEAEFDQQVSNIFVYARVSPEQKLRIVKGLQNNQQFVAMTGDGVNDAPSLKQANIGVSMGITGTDVAKEASDMILLDDNFATIVKAVREGRRIYENIRKFILYVLSCNLGEILTIFFAPIIGLPMPLLPIQILWINLVTDGLPGLALVTERAERDIMHRPPTPPKENLFAGGLISRILSTAFVMGASSLIIQWWVVRNGYDLPTQQTTVFTFLCFVQLANALSVRSVLHSFFSRDIFTNSKLLGAIGATIILQLTIVYVPFLQDIFKTRSLPWSILGIVLFMVLLCILSFEWIKTLSRKKRLLPS